MMTSILAAAAEAGQNPSNPDIMKILGWASALILGVLTITVKPILESFKRRWQSEALKDAHVTVKSPVPTIHTREEVELVTKPELDEKLEELRADIHELKQGRDEERRIAREAFGRVHARVDTVIENQAVSRGELKQINQNVQRLLDTATKTPRRNG